MHPDVQDPEFYNGVRGIAETVITEWPKYRRLLSSGTVERRWYEPIPLGEGEDSSPDFRECSEKVELYSDFAATPVHVEMWRVSQAFLADGKRLRYFAPRMADDPVDRAHAPMWLMGLISHFLVYLVHQHAESGELPADDFDEVYVHMERGLLSREVGVHVIVPILNVQFPSVAEDAPFKLTDDVSVVKLTRAMQIARMRPAWLLRGPIRMRIRASASRSTSKRCRRTPREVLVAAHTALSAFGSDATTREFSRRPTGKHPTRYRAGCLVSPSVDGFPASEALGDVAGNRTHDRHTPERAVGEDDQAFLSPVGSHQPKVATP